MDILCTVNPEVGREAEFDLKPAPSHKRVLVIGGGPGGMEAARVASLRGHRVSLYNEDDHLGGRIEAAFQTSFKNELKGIVRYYETILRRLGVEINLGRRVTAELAFELKPDAIVMATGSLPILPDIPGIHLPHVVQAFDVLLNRVKIEGRVGVVGGGMVGCEIATFLVEWGVKVVLLEMLPYVAYGIPRLLGKTMKEVMKQVGIEVMTNRKVVRIEEGFIVYKESEAKEVSLPVDWIVLATGAKPRDDLFKLPKGRFLEIYPIRRLP